MIKKIIIKYLKFLVKMINNIKCLKYKKLNIDKTAYIDETANFIGLRNIKVGENTTIGEYVWFNVNNRENNEDRIVIEDNCFIGKRCFFNSAKKIKIGSYSLIAPECKFVGSNHNYDDPFRSYVTTGTSDKEIIDIGVNCWFGTGVTVLGNVKIGYGSIIGASSMVNKDIPPFSIAVGNPARIVKRYDIKLKKWVKIEEYNLENDKLLLKENEYLEIIRSSTSKINKPYYAATSRFGDLL